MILCAACGYENRLNAKFCKNCGNRLSQPEVVALPTQANAATDARPLLDTALLVKQGSVGDADATLVTVVAPEETPNAPSATTEMTADLPTVDQPVSNAPMLEPTSPGSDSQTTTATALSPLLVEQTEAAPANDDTPATPLNSSPSLVLGEIIDDRYWVTGSSQTETGVVYAVEDHGVCRSCGVVVRLTAEEPYCFECGAHLLDSTLPWPQLRLRPMPASPGPALASSPFVTWQGQPFELLAETTSPTAIFTQGVYLVAGQRSDVGAMRTGHPDEDSIFALTLSSLYESQAQPTLGLYLVADGMGGHGDGEIASRIAVETISVTLLQSLILPTLQFGAPAPESITRQIEEAIQLANRRIGEQAQVRKNEMGTTITLAFVVNDLAYIANVGDSRTYHWHSQGLAQVTEDHSAVYQLLKRGLLTGDEIYRHPRRNEILRSLGMAAPVKVDHFQVRMAPGNLLLLCCDGLWEMTRNEGIEEVLLQGFPDPQVICDELIRRANQAGGEDNISVIAVRILA